MSGAERIRVRKADVRTVSVTFKKKAFRKWKDCIAQAAKAALLLQKARQRRNLLIILPFWKPSPFVFDGIVFISTRIGHSVQLGRVCARRARSDTRCMIGFLALLGASLAGLAGMGPWVIAICAVALAAASRAKYDVLYLRVENMGLSTLASTTTLKSMLNATVASTVAFGGGLLLRLLA